MNLYITGDAEADLDQIENYIGDDNPAAAINFLKRLTNCFTTIAQNPGIGRKRDNLKPGSRSITEGDYVIIYRLKQNTVEILRILHGRRDIESIFHGKH